ncbi:hypothetical protein NE865_07020 [Phthorimaea operculella]|nr:hypothetical protein NE865_07020 [Phthorimaea operculella]
MGIPSSFPHDASSECPQFSKRQVFDNLSQVDERSLEIGLESASAAVTLSDPQPTESVSRHINRSSTSSPPVSHLGGMVSTGWNELLHSWPPSLRSVIESSWRASTLGTYKSAWSKWTTWCDSRSINPIDPTAADIAFYLAHLFRFVKLSYKTILVHKSVIVNFSNPLKSAELSSHALVQRVLKGIANESAAKSHMPPIWNPQVVITWLMNNESRTDSLFEVSRRCALILLLASERRVHDLTLLSIAPGNFIMESESVVMWPVFGSKTDSLSHRQSGWQLTAGAHPNVDPIRWIRLLLEISGPS